MASADGAPGCAYAAVDALLKRHGLFSGSHGLFVFHIKASARLRTPRSWVCFPNCKELYEMGASRVSRYAARHGVSGRHDLLSVVRGSDGREAVRTTALDCAPLVALALAAPELRRALKLGGPAGDAASLPFRELYWRHTGLAMAKQAHCDCS